MLVTNSFWWALTFIAPQKRLRHLSKHISQNSRDFFIEKSKRFGTTLWLVNNDKMFIFRWNIILRESDSTVKEVKETFSLSQVNIERKLHPWGWFVFTKMERKKLATEIFELIRWHPLFTQTLIKSIWKRQNPLTSIVWTKYFSKYYFMFHRRKSYSLVTTLTSKSNWQIFFTWCCFIFASHYIALN